MAGPVTDGKATGAKKEPHYSVADRMNRIPTSPHTTLIIFFVLMGWFAETIDLGGTSFLMPTIREYFGMDATTGGYYSSICFLGMFIGAIAAGRIADKVGRKKTIVVSMFIWGVAGFALVASPNVYYLFTMRFILGLGLGAQFPVALSYLSELVSGKDRPKFMTLYQLMTPVGFAVAGVLTVLILPHFDWRGVYLAEALPALFVIGIIKCCPESPLWLEAKGRWEEADAICTKFEQEAIARHKELPPVEVIERVQTKATFKDLFSSKYLKVTILCFFGWHPRMVLLDVGGEKVRAQKDVPHRGSVHFDFRHRVRRLDHACYAHHHGHPLPVRQVPERNDDGPLYARVVRDEHSNDGKRSGDFVGPNGLHHRADCARGRHDELRCVHHDVHRGGHGYHSWFARIPYRS